MAYGTQWVLPAVNGLRTLRANLLDAVWGSNAKMRAQEVVIAVLGEPTVLEPMMASWFVHVHCSDYSMVRSY